MTQSFSDDDVIKMVRRALDAASKTFQCELYRKDLVPRRFLFKSNNVVEIDELLPGLNATYCGKCVQFACLEYQFFKTALGIIGVFAVSGSSDESEPSVKFGSGLKITTKERCLLLGFKHTPEGPEDQVLYVFTVPLRLCGFCGDTLHKSYKCSKCKDVGITVHYCSKACQLFHWKEHRPVCGKASDFLRYINLAVCDAQPKMVELERQTSVCV